jgi:hypothetical protein
MHARSLWLGHSRSRGGPSDRYRNPGIPLNLPEKDACRPVYRPPLQLLSNAVSRRGAIPVAFTGTGAGCLKDLSDLEKPTGYSNRQLLSL